MIAFRHSLPLALVVLTTAFANSAVASVALISANRSISGVGIDLVGSPPNQSYVEIPGSIAANGFDPFNQTLVLGAVQPFVAKQTSAISVFGFSGVGEAFATNAFIKNTKVASGSGGSDFKVEFAVDEPTPFSLVGSVESVLGFPFGAGLVRLDGPGIELIFANLKDNKNLVTFNENGILAPGAYTLTAFADAFDPGPPGANAHGKFQFNFLIPSPGLGGVLGLGGAVVLASRRRR